MPVISITLLPGYSQAAQNKLVARVTLAARSVIAAAAAGTTVFVNCANTYECDGRALTTDGTERVDSSALVRNFLDLMQDRDLAAASRLLAPDFRMQFPGSPLLHRLEQLVERSGGDYRRVAKTYERFDESWTDDGAIVYCFGSLYGEWLDGTPFDDVRFIDRFVVTNGLISRQDVWNDLALRRPSGT